MTDGIEGADLDVRQTAAAVRQGRVRAEDRVTACLDRIARRNDALNCFTLVTAERALAAARAVDAAVRAGRDPGPLAGVPFAVKNLFDIAGQVTVAGSRIHADKPPAIGDSAMVRRMSEAGAVLIGALNMDEYAYGFTTENSHYGPTRNPHDPSRIAGGSSGGSAAAVAAGLVPLTFGTDTNGSVRVPAALCGVFGLKPTFGRLSRAGVLPFVHSLDHVGLFARTVADLALAYDVAQGPDARDPVQAERPIEPSLGGLADGVEGLRVGVLDGWFQENATAEALDALSGVAAALKADSVTLPAAETARAAAFCITAAEGAAFHFADLRDRASDFDPATRDRLLAGALVPAATVLRAQKFRRWFQARVAAVFDRFDILLAPATPFAATPIGQATMPFGDRTLNVRANIGLYTQPLSFVGLPVLAIPVHRPGALPLGVQVIGAPWREALLMQVAAWLEARGVATATPVP